MSHPFHIEPYRRDQLIGVQDRSYLSLPYYKPQAVTWEGFDFKRPAEHCWFSLVGVPALGVDVFCRRVMVVPEMITFDPPVADLYVLNGERVYPDNGGYHTVGPRWEGRCSWELDDPEQAASFLRLLKFYKEQT